MKKATLHYRPYSAKQWHITTSDGQTKYFSMLFEAEDWAEEHGYTID